MYCTVPDSTVLRTLRAVHTLSAGVKGFHLYGIFHAQKLHFKLHETFVIELNRIYNLKSLTH